MGSLLILGEVGSLSFLGEVEYLLFLCKKGCLFFSEKLETCWAYVSCGEEVEERRSVSRNGCVNAMTGEGYRSGVDGEEGYGSKRVSGRGDAVAYGIDGVGAEAYKSGRRNKNLKMTDPAPSTPTSISPPSTVIPSAPSTSASSPTTSEASISITLPPFSLPDLIQPSPFPLLQNFLVSLVCIPHFCLFLFYKATRNTSG